jgi:hypothetical protein
MLSMITSPTSLQATTEDDGSFTVVVNDFGHGLSVSDYEVAEMNGHIEIHVMETLSTGLTFINYSVN